MWERNIPQKYRCLFRKDSRRRKIWDMIVFVSLILHFCFALIIIGTQTDSSYQIMIQLLIKYLFIADLIVNLRTTFYNKEGDQIFKAKSICWYYINSFFFIIDIITLIPLCLLTFHFLNFYNAFSLVPIIRIIKLQKQLQTLNLKFRTKSIMKVGMYIMMLVIIIFTAGALWLMLIQSSCRWYPIIFHPNFSTQVSICEGASKSRQFLLSLVYTNIMIISEGQAFPQDSFQLVMASILLLFGSFVDAILFGVVVNSIKMVNSAKAQLNEQFNGIYQNLRDLGFSKKKWNMINHQLYGSTLSAFKQIQIESFLKNLSPSLRQQVLKDLIYDKFRDVQIIEKSTFDAFAAQIEIILKQPQETLFHYNSKSDGIYFLINGKVELYYPHQRKNKFKYLTKLLPGSHFGEVGSLLNTTRSLTASIGKLHSTLAFLSIKNLQKNLWGNNRYIQYLRNKIFTLRDRLVQKLQQYFIQSCLMPGKVIREMHLQFHKFRIRQYSKNQYIWQTGSQANEVFVILQGRVSFQIQIGEISMPVYVVGRKQIIGFDHSLSRTKHQCSAFCQQQTRVAVYPIDSFLKLRQDSAQIDEWCSQTILKIQFSQTRPYPIDIVPQKRKNQIFAFKNIVIKLVQQAKRLRRRSFQENLKKIEKKDQKKKMRRAYLSQSIYRLHQLSLRGRQYVQVAQSDMKIREFIMHQYMMTRKMNKAIDALSKCSNQLKLVDRKIINGISQMKDESKPSSTSRSQQSLDLDEELKQEVGEMKDSFIFYKQTQIFTHGTCITEAFLPTESFKSQRIEALDSLIRQGSSFLKKQFLPVRTRQGSVPSKRVYEEERFPHHSSRRKSFLNPKNRRVSYSEFNTEDL